MHAQRPQRARVIMGRYCPYSNWLVPTGAKKRWVSLQLSTVFCLASVPCTMPPRARDQVPIGEHQHYSSSGFKWQYPGFPRFKHRPTYR